jgi:lipoprotein-releasing system permease protein
LIENELRNSLESKYSQISSYISKKVILSSKELAEGIILNGIDPSYAEMSLNRIIIEGTNDLQKNKTGIIIGKKLADKFNIKIGDQITIFSLNNDSPPSISNLPLVEQFKLLAIYESGMAEYDDIHAYINFTTSEDFFELDNEVTGYNINLENPEEIDSVKLVLSDMLSYPYYVRSYRDINKHIFTWLELQQKPVPIVLGLIIIVAVFNIVGAVLMLIVQKTSAIGVLRSMGVNSKQILQIFLLQGVSLALIGIAIGNFLAFSLSYIQNEFKVIKLPEEIYYLSSVPININLEIYIMISIIGLLISFLTSLIPSYIASRIQPLTAIKFN